MENKVSITELGDPSKPHGEAGAEMLKEMNEHHSSVTTWALGFLDVKNGESILDIGCGGGETLRRLSEMNVSGKLTGVDHSEVSVTLSKEHNIDDVSSGKMEIVKGSVEKLPFEDNTFNKIITVESFYFWPEPSESLKEVYRVLAPKGRFLVVADIYGNAELSKEEIENILKYDLYNPTLEEFRSLFTGAGFTDVNIHTKKGKNWVCAEGNK